MYIVQGIYMALSILIFLKKTKTFEFKFQLKFMPLVFAEMVSQYFRENSSEFTLDLLEKLLEQILKHVSIKP